MKLDVEIRGVETLCRQLEALTSDSQDRRALARRMGRKALTLARRRVKKQKNLDGSPFAPRKDKRNKRKLLEWIYSRGVVPFSNSSEWGATGRRGKSEKPGGRLTIKNRQAGGKRRNCSGSATGPEAKKRGGASFPCRGLKRT